MNEEAYISFTSFSYKAPKLKIFHNLTRNVSYLFISLIKFQTLLLFF